MNAPTKDDGEFTVERGVSPPVAEGRVRYPWHDMAAGDSFFVKCDRPYDTQRNTLGTSGRNYCMTHAPTLRVSVRVVDGGLRVWLLTK